MKLDPTFFHSLRNLADIYIELHREADAKEMIDRALKIRPENEELIALAEKFK